ncbi:retrovirus-related pol polyprotein from transposon TNT 1-94, partial [Tanacetum coccineum]
VFNTRRPQTEETYHITFDESPDAIKFTKPSVDNINIAESERYPPDEYLHSYEPSQRYQTNNNDVSFIEPYESPKLVVLEAESKHTYHNNDDPIIDNLTNTEDVQNPEPNSTPVKDTSVPNTIPISIVPSSSIIYYLSTGMLTRAIAKELSAASAHECLFVDFLFEEEPKKVSEALKHPGWVDAMQDELNQFARNKVWTLVPAPYGKTIISSKWVLRNKRDETGIVIKNKARLVAQGYNQQERIDMMKPLLQLQDLKQSRSFLPFPLT